MIINECHVIINSAASVKFNDPIHDALNINYFGSMRMLELAKECKNLQVFCQVSTTYVNSDLPVDSVVEEMIYS